MTRPLLILDLDETLIHATTRPLEVHHDFVWGDYLVHLRPGVEEFIESCSRFYDLAVWTSATADYAAGIVAILFGDVALAFTWARDRCTRRFDAELQEHYWIKDLRKVHRAGFELGRVLVVDDTPRMLERNYGNLVAVSGFTGDPADCELARLTTYLSALANEGDFRKIEKRRWRTAG